MQRGLGMYRLILVALLSACTSTHPMDPQPAVRQRHVTVKVQPHKDQGDQPTPRKRKHDIEED